MEDLVTLWHEETPKYLLKVTILWKRGSDRPRTTIYNSGLHRAINVDIHGI